ncbi:MAG: hypothetical protein LBS93_05990 [Synergistaceae bacterium]|nr:hypothetical protein [Synergistaceae bacterium]
MNRAFVKEDDAELSSYRDDEAHGKKMLEWLHIQEKKLDFLLNDPKGRAIEAAKRARWIEEAESAIKLAKEELGI